MSAAALGFALLIVRGGLGLLLGAAAAGRGASGPGPRARAEGGRARVALGSGRAGLAEERGELRGQRAGLRFGWAARFGAVPLPAEVEDAVQQADLEAIERAGPALLGASAPAGAAAAMRAALTGAVALDR
jgi:hypothetical protein